MKPAVINLTITYQEFEPGDIVTPANENTTLNFGEFYEVDCFYKPPIGTEKINIYGLVCVKDWPFGVNGKDLVYRPDMTAADLPLKKLIREFGED